MENSSGRHTKKPIAPQRNSCADYRLFEKRLLYVRKSAVQREDGSSKLKYTSTI
jgi:hypothetical protein